MNTDTVYELNHKYMVVSGDEIDRTENYRYKMLSANDIDGIIPLEIRLINAEKKIYIDITGKESLLDFFKVVEADREEVKSIFDAIYIVTSEISKFLIGETDVLLRPELIYKNISTSKIEFVCIPLIEEGIPINQGMKTLLQFLMGRLDNTDEKLVNAIYTMYDLFETGLTKFSIAYEYFIEEIKEESEIEEIDLPVEEERIIDIYFPSLREITAFGMCAVGLVLIGYNIYLSMLL